MDQLSIAARECLAAGLPPAKTMSIARKIRKTEKITGYMPLRLSILATSNIDFLAQALEVASFADRIHLETFTAGFNQIDQEVLNPQSAMYEFAPQIAILYARPEDIVSKLNYNIESVDQKQIDEWIRDIEHKINTWTSTVVAAGIKVIVFSFVKPAYPPLGIRDFHHPKGQSAIWKRLNESLANIVSNKTGVDVLDIELLVRRIGFSNWADPKLWSLAKIAGGARSVADYVQEIMPLIREAAGRRRKCLVLDLDNTLWGGVIGEDGVSGVKLGGDYPGSIYLEFQKRIIDLWNNGVILAINSKNNFDDANQMFETHPEMILKMSHFSAYRINWTDKSENLKAIAAELNIGLDSLVFADDNPVECERVASVHPEIVVFQLPAVIEQLPAKFAEICKFFDGTLVSEEDKLRNQMYQQNDLRKKEQELVNNVEDFLSALEMTAEVDSLNKGNLQRTVQLLQKTNQFNVTTRRHSEQFVADLINNPEWLTYVVRLKDKYGDNGIVLIALIQLKDGQAIFDTFLMSCRVIGRTLEKFVMDLVVSDLKDKGVHTVIGDFIPTSKNKLVEGLYPELGFTLLEETTERVRYHIALDAYKPSERIYINTIK